MKKVSKIKYRIQELAVNSGLTKEVYYPKIGSTPANFRGSKLETGVNSDVIEKIITLFPNIDLHWLITGEHKKEETLLLNEPKPSYGPHAEIEYLKELVKAKDETIAILKQQTGFKESNGKAS